MRLIHSVDNKEDAAKKVNWWLVPFAFIALILMHVVKYLWTAIKAIFCLIMVGVTFAIAFGVAIAGTKFVIYILTLMLY